MKFNSPLIPEQQWAQVFEEDGGEITFKQISVPEPKPDELLVNVVNTGVCHTDLHAWKGDWADNIQTVKPLVGGHEGAGVIVGLGSLVNKDNFKVGQKVGIPWINGTCDTCPFCIGGYQQLCVKPTISGYTQNGTFQQYARVQASQAIRIPDHCDLEDIAPIMCAGLTVYTALKTSECRPGQWIAIPGAGGGLGSYGIQYAKAMGLLVIAIDTGAEKKRLCEKLGADAFVDYATSTDIVKEVRSHTDGYGPQAAIVTAASEGPYNLAAKYLRPTGTVVMVGLPSRAQLKADIFDAVTRMINFKGSYVGSRVDAQEAVNFYALGKIKGHVAMRKLSQLKSVYDDMLEAKVPGRIVLDNTK